MKASTLRWAFVFAIAGAVGFQLGRHQFAVRANVVPAPDGGVAGKVSWSAVPPGSTCYVGGHVTWQPGLLHPRVHELAEDSDCVSD
jgi:hypothetical protein